MRDFVRVLAVLAIMGMFLMVTGCGKKKVEQVDEVVPPEVEVVEPQGQPEPVMPEPEIEVVEVVEVAAPTMEEQISVFEDRDVLFGYDKFNLTPEAMKILAEKASFLNANNEMKVRIDGNCDNRGSAEYNLALGERRARAASDYLVFLGIDPNRISTISYGEERPVNPANNEEAWAENRRDHFVITGQ
ncbi:MAG: peptidoglycan-associated lipoprotein Pal [Thermodesulfobacteriota bacterium]|nr:peptidoglycan-associated lipoprotein Pal [Thermodesulfobacteriota bacterium]